MPSFGYTLMCEQSAPNALVDDAVRAEAAGFDFAVISDHYSPWLDSQGHAPNAWPVLGAVAHATNRIELMTYVTAPIMRYHPAVIAQQAATVDLLAGGRFTLGLGAGENLNEHVVGRGWPPVNVRHEMLEEALEIISALFQGGYVNFVGTHFRVDSAKLSDLPDPPPRIALAVSGTQSIGLTRGLADALIAVEWAHDQFRWFAGGWKVNAELPGTTGFAAATQFVTKDDVADNISCGPDLDAHVAAVKKFLDAGFTHVAPVQIGGEHQTEFIDWAKRELLPALRAASSFRRCLS
ncbi:MAG: TIGR03557 family F420-dependent LLM class oxidoreductase [Jatrophihabitans sp.]